MGLQWRRGRELYFYIYRCNSERSNVALEVTQRGEAAGFSDFRFQVQPLRILAHRSRTPLDPRQLRRSAESGSCELVCRSSTAVAVCGSRGPGSRWAHGASLRSWREAHPVPGRAGPPASFLPDVGRGL